MSRRLTRTERFGRYEVNQENFQKAYELINRVYLIPDWAKSKNIEIGEDNRNSLCPFHDEGTPSFAVAYEENKWNCFGCSGIHGGGFVEFYRKYAEVYEDRTLSGYNAVQEILTADKALCSSLGFSSIFVLNTETSMDKNTDGTYLWKEPKKLKRISKADRSFSIKQVCNVLRNQPVEVIMDFISDCQARKSNNDIADKFIFGKVKPELKFMSVQDVYDDFMSALAGDDDD